MALPMRTRGRQARLQEPVACPDGKYSDCEREEIARVAYELYLQRGCEHGHDLEDWLNAEQLVMRRRREGR